MAAITATLNITFTSQYTGNHRVYWRIQGSGDPFTLDPTLVYCASGNTCDANVSVLVDYETCDSVTFEGYLQPVCFDESPTLDDFPPNPAEYSQYPDVLFTPAPVLNVWISHCIGVSISDVVVTNDPGNGGYTPGTYTNIPFTGGGGLGAEATVTVEVGGNILVGGIVVTNGGTGYTIPPTLDLSSITHDGINPVVTYTVNLDDCQNITGSGGEIYSGLTVGQSITICSDTDPSDGLNDWDGVEYGACVCETCTNVEVTNTSGGPLQASYYSCLTGEYYSEIVFDGSINFPLNGGICDAVGSTVVVEAPMTYTLVPCP